MVEFCECVVWLWPCGFMAGRVCLGIYEVSGSVPGLGECIGVIPCWFGLLWCALFILPCLVRRLRDWLGIGLGLSPDFSVMVGGDVLFGLGCFGMVWDYSI